MAGLNVPDEPHLSQRQITSTQETDIDKILQGLGKFLRTARFVEGDEEGVTLCEDQRLVEASKKLRKLLDHRKEKVAGYNVLRIQGGNTAHLTTRCADLIPIAMKPMDSETELEPASRPVISGTELELAPRSITRITEAVDVEVEENWVLELFYVSLKR
jgi:hypothetical protein